MFKFEIKKKQHPFPPEIPDLELADDLKKTVTLRAGSSLRLMISVTGRPAPIINWSKPGVDLASRGFIDTTDSYTRLIIEKVNRYDAGKYTIEAENASGKKAATIIVKVYGKLLLSCTVNLKSNHFN